MLRKLGFTNTANILMDSFAREIDLFSFFDFPRRHGGLKYETCLKEGRIRKVSDARTEAASLYPSPQPLY